MSLAVTGKSTRCFGVATSWAGLTAKLAARPAGLLHGRQSQQMNQSTVGVWGGAASALHRTLHTSGLALSTPGVGHPTRRGSSHAMPAGVFLNNSTVSTTHANICKYKYIRYLPRLHLSYILVYPPKTVLSQSRITPLDLATILVAARGSVRLFSQG